MPATFELLDAAVNLVDYAIERSSSGATVTTLLRMVEEISQDLASTGFGEPANLPTAPRSLAKTTP